MNVHRGKVAYDTDQAIPFVDSRIYSDQSIFEEELEKIWKQVWLACVHESEVAAALDFRTLTIARTPVVIVRGPDIRLATAGPAMHGKIDVSTKPIEARHDTIDA